jgi:ATP-dependent RNA helicase DHX29
MAKTKKGAQKRKDARGYGQQQQQAQPKSQPNNKVAPIVSSKTHDGLKNLLGQLGGGEEQQATPGESSHRFVSKLTSIVHRLQEFGFSDSQMELVASAVGYDMTLETSLDWLCLHLPTLELPALFTDGRVRNSLIMTTEDSSSLTVLKLVAPPPSAAPTTTRIIEEETNNKDIDESVTKEEEAQSKKKADAEAAEHKAWLLQRYQYEEDEEEGIAKEKSSNNNNMELTEPPPQLETPDLTPEEEHLAEKENELKELEEDLNSEANNYMRSKYEAKQLQTQVKKLRQNVVGLRKKVEKTKAKQQQQEQQQTEQTEASTTIGMVVDHPITGQDDVVARKEEEGDDYGGGGLFDNMFEQAEETKATAGAAPNKAEEQQPAKSTTHVLLDYCISKDWTGTTPQKTLEEFCKKQKLPKPKYPKLPHNGGYRLLVTLKKKQPAKEWQAKTSDFVKGSSLQDYLAIQTLYGIDPTLPLYRVFPPAFRDLWLSWQEEVQQAQNQVQQDQDTVKRERIERLLSLIAEKKNSNSNNNNKPSSNVTLESSMKTEKDESTDETIVQDNWEDEDTVDGHGTNNTNKAPSAMGKKIRNDFVRRQATKAYQAMMEVRNALPMASFRQQVLDTVRKHPVTILWAETGAGKTTQCPQYLLEEAILEGRGDNESVNILCTQPRRVAATSVAERVAEEMCESSIGKMVGYQIRMEAKRSAQTRLLFCTTGIVLRRLQEDSNLKGVTHVIVDEVHERQQQTDVLLIALRHLLRTSRPDLKVILVGSD